MPKRRHDYHPQHTNDTMNAMSSLHSPAAERNKEAILDVLLRVLPPQGRALEIASGSGQHVVCFASKMPGWTWLPSDVREAGVDSINTLAAEASLANLLPAIALDVLAPDWHLPTAMQRLDAMVCVNMLHISPWACCGALMQGAARHLAPQGRLVTYGPYRVSGLATAASNLAFDADLRARNPAWGLRQLDEVERAAQQAGLMLIETISMPANNLMLVFGRTSADDHHD